MRHKIYRLYPEICEAKKQPVLSGSNLAFQGRFVEVAFFDIRTLVEQELKQCIISSWTPVSEK